jgi:thioredoxin-dependent peroxiredoxin
MISIGQTAPDFTLPRDGGANVTLSALRPQKVVLYFYPKDDTSGCTLEAQDFTAALADFQAAGCTVIGVSKDSVAAHDKFCKKYGLGIVLASDAEGSVCED